MASAKAIGRTMGVLLILQIVLSSSVYFGVLDSVSDRPGGLLANAATYPQRMGLAAILLIAAGFISVALSSNAWPLFSKYSKRAANAYLVATGASLALLSVEAGTIMSMLTVVSST